MYSDDVVQSCRPRRSSAGVDVRLRIPVRRGATIVYCAFLMFALLTVAVFAVDFGRVRLVKAELQSAADAAALAGALRVDSGSSAAWVAASSTAAMNYADGRPVELLSQDVESGNWVEGRAPPFVAGGTPLNAVRVRTYRNAARSSQLQTMFGQAVGLPSPNLDAEAIGFLELPNSRDGFVGIDRVRFASLGVLSAIDGNIVSNGDVNIGMPLGLLVGVHGDARSYYSSTRKGPLATITGSTARLEDRLSFASPAMPSANDNNRIFNFLNAQGDFTGLLSARVPAGTYVVHDLNILAALSMNIEGPVTFHVTGNFNIAAGVNLLGATNIDPAMFKVRVHEGGSVNFLGNILTPFAADVYAPTSDISVAVAVNQFRGRLIGKTLDINLPVAGTFIEDQSGRDAGEDRCVRLVK